MKSGSSLSGNPFDAFATFELIARPIIAEISHRKDIFYKHSEGILQNNFNKKVAYADLFAQFLITEEFFCPIIINRVTFFLRKIVILSSIFT